MSYNFLVCFDYEYVHIAKAMLKSLYLNSGIKNFVVHCFTRNISNEVMKQINQYNLNIQQYNMTYNFEHYYNHLNHVTVSTMDRLLMTKILDSKVDRIVYLDIDLLILNNIKNLFKVDTKEKGIAARPSIEKNLLNIWIRTHRDKNKTAAKYFNFKHSFNAGVLVCDLKKLRKNNFYEQTKAYYVKAGFNDQIILNLYANQKYSQLDKKYNTYANLEAPEYDISILHFAGHMKPWQSEDNVYNRLWLKYS